jgi:hypothetical protein
VDIDLADQDPRIVVLSNFSELDTLEVVVSKSRSAFDSGPAEYLADASVAIFREGKIVEQLEYTIPDNPLIPPYFSSNFLVPEPEVEYTLRVAAPGLEPVEAKGLIPQAIPLDSSSLSFRQEVTQQDFFFNEAEFEIELEILDPLPQGDFYHLSFYQQGFNFRINMDGDTVKSPFYSLPLTLDPADDGIPLVSYLDERGVLIRDESMSLANRTLRFSGNFLYRRNDQLLGDFLIELRTVTSDYYLFHTSLARQAQASADPLSDPVILYSNVENGYGIFTGFASAFYLVEAPH